jgi:hypothetical protein
MTDPGIVVEHPPVAVLNYPIALGAILSVVLTAAVLYVAGKFDPTKGPLTISVLIVLGMLGSVGYCLMFTIPPDDITPGVVGGLTAGFGAVVAYWLGRTQAVRPHENPPDDEPRP